MPPKSPTLTTYVDKARGVWYVNVYWSADKANGRPATRKRISLGIPTNGDPSEALQFFRESVLPVLNDECDAVAAASVKKPPGRKQGPLLRDLAMWYLDTHLPYIGSAKKTTERYTSSLWDFIGFCSTRHVSRAGQLSTRIVEEWQMHQCTVKGRSGPSRDEVLHVRRWLSVCQDHGEMEELPNIKWTIPRKKKGVKNKAHERDVIDPWLQGLCAWRPLVGLVARWVDATGWRIGDTLDLRIGEIDLLRNIIDRMQIKTSSQLPYPVTPALHALIQEALARHTDPKPADHLFLNHNRHPWTYPQIYRVLQNYHNPKQHWAGPVVTFRDLRKSFGTHLAMEGCPPNVLKELMGHSDITMTLTYYVEVDLGRMAEWSVRHTSPGTHEKK